MKEKTFLITSSFCAKCKNAKNRSRLAQMGSRMILVLAKFPIYAANLSGHKEQYKNVSCCPI